MSQPRKSSRVTTALVLLWIIPGIIFLFLTATTVVRQPNFRLSLGLLHATGAAALVIALGPALLGIVALVLLFRVRPLGAKLLLMYCLFWLADFLGTLVYNWSDLAANRALTSGPASARVAVPSLMIAFLASFALCAVWCWRRVRA